MGAEFVLKVREVPTSLTNHACTLHGCVLCLEYAGVMRYRELLHCYSLICVVQAGGVTGALPTLPVTRTRCVTWLLAGGRAENRCEKLVTENGPVTTTVEMDRAFVAPCTGLVRVLQETPPSVEVRVLGLLASRSLLLLVLHLCAWETVTRTREVVTGVRTTSSSVLTRLSLLELP